MKLLTLSVVLLSGTLVALAVVNLVSTADTRPTRAQCIAGAELLWTGKEHDEVAILNQIADVDPLTRMYPRGGSAIHHDTHRIYIIFTQECAMKDEMMERIMTIYQWNIPDFPHYRVIKGPIQPSPQTIQVYGEPWSDGEMLRGLMD